MFKIQHVRNAFPLQPVSYSRLASYLECPGCALDQKRKRRSKGPKQFTSIHQGSLFGHGGPDARLVGTLLHALVTILHDSQGPIARGEVRNPLADEQALSHFLYHDALSLLKQTENMQLAIFFDGMLQNRKHFYREIVLPLQRYRQTLVETGDVIVEAMPHFQCKLLSTGKTFTGHPGWGGHVALVGEFDQIRLCKTPQHPEGVLTIVEFKKNLTSRKKWKTAEHLFLMPQEEEEAGKALDAQALDLPDEFHAFQLMVYWLAFQTRWDIMPRVKAVKGTMVDIAMPLQQELDLMIYNLQDGSRYRLCLDNQRTTLTALVSCIFYLDWAMKSGYARQVAEHECNRTKLLDLPDPPVQVGAGTIPAGLCYQLARDAFERFRSSIRWEKQEPVRTRRSG